MEEARRKAQFAFWCVFALMFAAVLPCYAASYQFHVSGAARFSTDTPHCVEVFEVAARHMNEATKVATGSQTAYYFYSGACQGSFRTVGQSMAANMGLYTAGGWGTQAQTITLEAITEDDQDDEVSGIPLQRVIVGAACLVLFAIGWLAGRLR